MFVVLLTACTPVVAEVPVLLESEHATSFLLEQMLGASLHGVGQNEEAISSRLPDLSALHEGEAWQPVTQDLAVRLDDCVQVVKAMDAEHGVLVYDAEFESCEGRSGSIDVRHHFASLDGDSLPTGAEVVFAGYRQEGVELQGVVVREDHHHVETGTVTMLEQADLELFVDVSDQVEARDALTVVPMDLRYELTLDLGAEGALLVSGDAEVQAQGRQGTLTVEGEWSQDCQGGGWAGGWAQLDVEGQVSELELSCQPVAEQAKFALIDVIVAIILTASVNGVAISYVFKSGPGVGYELEGLQLEHAFLAHQDLTASNLSYASLVGADLTGANLSGANLLGADLQDAVLTDVLWASTTCPDGNSSDLDGTCVGHLGLTGGDSTSCHGEAEFFAQTKVCGLVHQANEGTPASPAELLTCVQAVYPAAHAEVQGGLSSDRATGADGIGENEVLLVDAEGNAAELDEPVSTLVLVCTDDL